MWKWRSVVTFRSSFLRPELHSLPGRGASPPSLRSPPNLSKSTFGGAGRGRSAVEAQSRYARSASPFFPSPKPLPICTILTRGLVPRPLCTDLKGRGFAPLSLRSIHPTLPERVATLRSHYVRRFYIGQSQAPSLCRPHSPPSGATPLTGVRSVSIFCIAPLRSALSLSLRSRLHILYVPGGSKLPCGEQVPLRACYENWAKPSISSNSCFRLFLARLKVKYGELSGRFDNSEKVCLHMKIVLKQSKNDQFHKNGDLQA